MPYEAAIASNMNKLMLPKREKADQLYQSDIEKSIIFIRRNGFSTCLLYFSFYKQHMGLL